MATPLAVAALESAKNSSSCRMISEFTNKSQCAQRPSHVPFRMQATTHLGGTGSIMSSHCLLKSLQLYLERPLACSPLQHSKGVTMLSVHTLCCSKRVVPVSESAAGCCSCHVHTALVLQAHPTKTRCWQGGSWTAAWGRHKYTVSASRHCAVPCTPQVPENFQ